MSEMGSPCDCAVMLTQKPEHVPIAALDFNPERLRNREHCPAEQRSAADDFKGDRPDCLFRRAPDLWVVGCRAGIELHDTREVCDGFNTAQGKDDVGERHPVFAETGMRRLQVSQSKMWSTERDDGNDDNHHGQSEGHRDTAGVFRAKIVHITNQQNESNRGRPEIFFGHAEIEHRIPTTHRRGHDEVGQQQQRAEYRQHPALLARRGIDTPAIGKMPANDNIIVADETGQNADRQNDGEGREPGGDKGQPNNVGFAGTPVTIEQSCCPGPADVSRTMCAYFHQCKSISTAK